MKHILLFIVLITGVIFTGFSSGNEEKEDGTITIAIVSKGFQHEFWQTVRLGSEAATKELGIESYFIGPPNETMIEQQISMAEDAITKRVTGILIAALDSNALVPVVKKAKSRGIIVAAFDAAPNTDVVSFVATNNVAAGAMAAKELGKIINGKGLIGVVSHAATSGNGIDRRDGFRNYITKNFPTIAMLDTIYGEGGDHQITMDRTLDMIKANPDIVAIYATNEGTAVGVGLAIKQLKKADSITVIGFDSSEQEIGFLKEGIIDGFIVQNPYKMGYLGVKKLYESIQGKSVEKIIDTGAEFVSMKNFNDATIQKLIYPLGK